LALASFRSSIWEALKGNGVGSAVDGKIMWSVSRVNGERYFNGESVCRKSPKDSPSLKRFVEPEALEAYADAVELASYEIKIPESTFPAECPYTIENILDKDFWPD
jgi:hypothetical protein